jgi:surfeit locus 1 family protein
VTTDTAAPAKPKLGFGFWSFIVFMLALTALWIVLGVWQLDRLAWKEGLIAQVTARFTQPPTPLPPADQWPTLDPGSYDFRPVSVSGSYLMGKTVPVFVGLTDAKGRYNGPGYWIMAPFAPDGGGTVWINLGFVPQDQSASYVGDKYVPQGHMLVTGIATISEDPGAFTPAPDTANHIEWVRSPARLSAMAGLSGPLLNLIVDLPAGPPGALPQGGETVIDFPNNHLGYAYTWFGFALITPALLAAWVFRQVRPKAPAAKP